MGRQVRSPFDAMQATAPGPHDPKLRDVHGRTAAPVDGSRLRQSTDGAGRRRRPHEARADDQEIRGAVADRQETACRPFLIRRHPLINVKVPLDSEDINHQGDGMTVCIAARCGGTIVAATDRMLTAGDVQFESTAGIKIQALSNFAFIMTAGDAALSAELVQETGHQIRDRIIAQPNNIWMIKDIVDLHIDKYNNARLKRSEAQILAPLNLDRNTFLSGQASPHTGLVSDLTKELINFSMPSMSSIVAGIDTTGAHVYVVRDDEYTCADSVGFAAIGIGARHAQSQLMLAGQSYNSSLTDTVLSVYVAKRRSEIAPGVGKYTEMVSVGPGNPLDFLHKDIMNKLEVEYKRIIDAESTAFLEGRKEMEDYVKKLTEQAPQSGTGGVSQTPPSPEGSSGSAASHGRETQQVY